MNYPIRINKYLRDKKIASRREADSLIEKGLVLVNGKIATKGLTINKEDKVVVKKIDKKYHYLAYYKPKGLATQDHPGKKSVVNDWKEKGIYPVGRLDKESEGLLLLTNDGRFATEVLSQKEKWEKEYMVTVKENLNEKIVETFKEGMETETFGKLLPAKAEIVNNNKIKIILNEGKKHQIRVMLSELSYTVTSLKRIRIGGIKLGRLNPGDVKKIDNPF